MKIALICPYDYYRPGGVQSHIRDLAIALRQRNHEVKVIAPPSAEIHEPEKEVSFFGKRKSIMFNKSQIDLSLVYGDEKKRLKKYLEKEAFDILHFHTIWDPFLPIQILAFAKTSARVATFHDTPPDTFGGQMTRRVFHTLSRILYRWLDEVIAVSCAPAAHLYKTEGQEIHIAPPCINYDTFREDQNKSKERANEETISLLFVGRFDPRKAVLDLLRAYKNLQKNMPHLDLKIVGSGEQETQIRDYVSNEGLSKVQMLGRLSEAEKITALQQADIFCSPALYGESFGITLVESMSAGTPVIAAANRGYKTVLAEKEEYCLFEPGNVDALTERLRNLILDPQLRADLADWGRQKSVQHDVKNWVERFEGLYSQAVEKRLKN